MPYKNKRDIYEFILYMLNTCEGDFSNISFICGKQKSNIFPIIAEIVAEKNLPPVAIYSLPYMLPQFCRKMNIPNNYRISISFEGEIWLVEKNTVTPIQQSNSPCYLNTRQIAELFFAKDPDTSDNYEADSSSDESSPLGELAQFVLSSAVQPRSKK